MSRVALSLLAAVLVAMPVAAATSTNNHKPSDITVETPTEDEFERQLPEGEALSGDDLYDRFLKNKKRLRTAYQEGRILSKDPGGNPQETQFWSRWKDYRDPNDDAVGGVYSKSLVKLSGPYEVRHTGYLYVHRSDRADEQFMYSPSRGRTLRVAIKGQNIQGTDFSIDDFLLSLDDLEDAEYRRLPDEIVQGVPCYVVEAVATPESKSAYSRSIVSMEQEHYVPLRTRYWDEFGVESKELTAPHASIREFDGAWIPTESKMTDLLEQTSSTMHIDRLDPNPPFEEVLFAIGVLEVQPSSPLTHGP